MKQWLLVGLINVPAFYFVVVVFIPLWFLFSLCVTSPSVSPSIHGMGPASVDPRRGLSCEEIMQFVLM